MKRTRIWTTTTVALLLAWASTASALDPAPKCQAGKNKEAGKYAACRQKAEAKAITTGDPADYTKCDGKFFAKWAKLEETAGVGVCPDGIADPNSLTDFITDKCDAVAAALAGGGLPECGDNTINMPGEQCDGTDVGGESCVSLGFESGTLACASCAFDTSGCVCPPPTGDAAVRDVLSGKTFSNAGGTGLSGTMANNGAVVLTPSISNQPVAAGYYSGSSYCEGDADLVSGNIRSTVSIFGVAGDADLVAGNIVKDVDLFGVVGTQPPAQPLRTGQTQCDQGAGTLGACPGSPAGQDGALLKGATRTHTDNGNGTITDNKTGLMWEKLDDNNANGIHDYSAGFTWYNAFKKIQVLNGNAAGCIAANNPDACCTGAGTGSCSAFAGQTGWRLPNRFELETLADLGRVNPAIDPVFNTSCAASCTVLTCSCTQSLTHWSSTTYQFNPAYAWYVFFYGGDVNDDFKSNGHYVRAARGGS